MSESVGASTTLQMPPLDSKEPSNESMESLQNSTANLNSLTSSEQFSSSLCQSDADISLNERLNALLMDTKPLKSSVQTELPWLASKQTSRTPPPTASNAEWNRREVELAERERALRQQAFTESRAPNFPFFYPILRHDIDSDIPTDAKHAVSLSYATCKTLIFTLVVALASEIVWHATKLAPIQSVVLSLVYLVFVPAFVFFFAHLRLYYAVRHNSTVNFAGYFAAALCVSVFFAFMTVGLLDGNGGGILGLIHAISTHKIAAAILACATCGLLFGVLMMNLYTAALAFKYYRSTPSGRMLPPERQEIRRSVVVERHAQV